MKEYIAVHNFVDSEIRRAVADIKVSAHRVSLESFITQFAEFTGAPALISKWKNLSTSSSESLDQAFPNAAIYMVENCFVDLSEPYFTGVEVRNLDS